MWEASWIRRYWSFKSASESDRNYTKTKFSQITNALFSDQLGGKFLEFSRRKVKSQLRQGLLYLFGFSSSNSFHF